MKEKKCPYCGRRISYLTVFHEKKHGVYECTRCKKESKIKVDKKLIISFIIFILLIVLYAVFWKTSGFYNSILGIIPPIIVLIAFYFCTPFFIRFVPLKRFLDDIEKKQEQQISTDEINTSQDFIFNKRIFDEIKNKRSNNSSIDEKINQINDEEEKYIPVIENVSEAHTSSQSTLKKVTKHPVQPVSIDISEEDVKQYVPKKEKPSGTKYTANRKF